MIFKRYSEHFVPTIVIYFAFTVVTDIYESIAKSILICGYSHNFFSFPSSGSIPMSSYLSSFLYIFSLFTFLGVMPCPYTFSGHSDTPTCTAEPANLRPTVPPPPAILMISILHTNVVSYFSSVM